MYKIYSVQQFSLTKRKIQDIRAKPQGKCCQLQYTDSEFCLTGNMRVLVVNSQQPTQKTYVWYKTGNQGNSWNMATVDIGQLSAGYKVCPFFMFMMG